MIYLWFGFASGVAIFVAMMICMNIGYYFGRKQLNSSPNGGKIGGTMDAAVFGLLGLILAFSFGGAASRFDARRHLVVEEANAIGTAFLRIELLASEYRPEMRERFRRYLDSRLNAYAQLPDVKAALAELALCEVLQREIWVEAQRTTRLGKYMSSVMLLLPAINSMIDITTTRIAATRLHPPLIIFGLLFFLALLSSLLVGYGMADCINRRWLYMFIFAIAISMTIYVICDMEFPRLGLIRVDDADRVLIDLRNSMDEGIWQQVHKLRD